MPAEKLRYRQVHLDFHTSPAIPSVGESFSREQFAEALKLGHVNSITLFSKCHHGYAYHPSEANEMHPGLHFDLLGEQLAVCRELGINAPVYLSAGLDEKEAIRHPEWLNIPRPGAGPDYVNHVGYKLFCYNTPYLDKLIAQVEEVMQRYNPSGIFLDISAPRVCYCSHCIRSMHELGLDPADSADVKKHAEMVYANYGKRVEEAVHKYNPETTIFHNAGNIARGRRDIADFDTHLELESLPTGGWGYDHFPMSASYVRTLGKDFLGQTGKFHTTWGEFGGFKHPNALRYETSQSLALGARCEVGDQLHPSGEMNFSTYRLIGKAYAEVEEKEPWCINTKAVSDIAVLSSEAISLTNDRNCKPDIGACRMLFEGHYLFDLIDLETPFENYKVLILPDNIPCDEALTARLNAYLSTGGKLLVTGSAGLKTDGSGFAIDLSCKDDGVSEYCPTYMVPDEKVPMVNGSTSYVMYSNVRKIVPEAGAELFAEMAEPYFNRTVEHFCSHQHTPDKPHDRHPAAVFGKNTAYIAWNVFSDYAIKGSLCLKEIVHYAINRLLGDERSVTVTGLPERGVLTYRTQEKENRSIVHLVFAHTCKRGENIEAIEDTVPLYNLSLSVKADKAPKSVRLVPSGEALPFVYENGRIILTVPKVDIHAMIEIAD